MKRLAFLMVSLLLICVNIACADNERPIQVTELPANAQQLIKQHFSDRKVLLAKVETEIVSKSYEVFFADGDHIDFDSKGNWTEIECNATVVPAALVPAAISQYVKANYPEQTVKKIEKDRKEYEVKLSNRIELTFDTNFKLIDVDM